MKEKIATGVGYKMNGKKYEYPIFTIKELEIVRNSGGEIKPR